jgi:hypothetical protein
MAEPAADWVLPISKRPWCVFDNNNNFLCRFEFIEGAVHTVHTRGREGRCFILGPNHIYLSYREILRRFPMTHVRKLRKFIPE